MVFVGSVRSVIGGAGSTSQAAQHRLVGRRRSGRAAGVVPGSLVRVVGRASCGSGVGAGVGVWHRRAFSGRFAESSRERRVLVCVWGLSLSRLDHRLRLLACNSISQFLAWSGSSRWSRSRRRRSWNALDRLEQGVVFQGVGGSRHRAGGGFSFLRDSSGGRRSRRRGGRGSRGGRPSSWNTRQRFARWRDAHSQRVGLG